MYKVGIGGLFGFLFAACVFANSPPLPPLYAIGCAALDYPAAVLMNGDRVCLRNAEIISEKVILDEVVKNLRASNGDSQ